MGFWIGRGKKNPLVRKGDDPYLTGYANGFLQGERKGYAQGKVHGRREGEADALLYASKQIEKLIKKAREK